MTKLKWWVLLSVGGTSPILAAEIEPAVELGVIRTDNLTLADVDPEAATIWQLLPNLRVTQDSPRVTADVIYEIEAYHYRERDETEVFHQLDADLRVGFVPERFFFDVVASRMQAMVDPASPVPVNNFIASENGVDLDQLGAGPAFEVPVGEVTFSGEWRRTWVNYADPLQPGLEDEYHYDNGEFEINNFRRASGLSWAVRYERDFVEYEQTLIPFEYKLAGLELGFWVGDSRLFATGGKESPWDEPLDSTMDDSFWEVGFYRAVEGGLTTELGFGERTYGSSRRARFVYESARGAFELSYEETPTTTSADRFLRGGMFDPDEPFDYLFRAGSVLRYVSKRYSGTFGVELQRTEFSLNLLSESREQGTLIDGTPILDETQDGGNLTFTWSVGPRLDLILGGVRAHRDVADGGGTDFTSSMLSAEYELGPRTRLSFTFQDWKEQTETSEGLSYRAKLISASVMRTFR